MVHDDVTAYKIRSFLKYNQDTGTFIWNERRGVRKEWNTRYAGTVAGYLNQYNGYINIRIGVRNYRANRLAWLYMTGEWPNEEIDHINGDRSDNRMANLRAATRSQNSANRGLGSNNSSGLKGVSRITRNGKWQSGIFGGRQRRHLGVFDCPAAAHFAYIVAADKAFGEFAKT